ncbi:MAG: phage major capsid protein [Candidatus Komeilibacteria bacterium]|nr:phage major capsid protein [Candidatus Komeilibacteria bacterium]
MLIYLKMLKALLKKGFATKAEKEALKAEFSKLKQEEQEPVKEETEQAEKLPEVDPLAGAGGGEPSEEKTAELLSNLLRKEAQGIQTNLEVKVKEWLEEHKDLMAKKAGVYQPDIAAKRKGFNEHIRALAKALITGDEAKFKEMTTDAQGTPYAGYVVDSELSAEVRHLMTDYGVARRELTSLQLTKHTYKANELVTDLTVYWVDEGAVISSSQLVLDQNSLSLKKLGVIVTLTSELLEEQEIDLFSLVAERAAEKFARAEDDFVFNGDGTSDYGSFTGLLLSANVNETVMAGTTFASIDADDLLDMQIDTPAAARARGKYFMHFSIMALVRKLKAEGDYIFQRPSETGPASIWGKPVVEVEVMPTSGDSAEDTAFVIFGDLKAGALFGYQGAIRAERFDAGVVRNVAANADLNLITTDRKAIRLIERVGYVQLITTLNKPITVLKTAEASA